MAASLFLQQDFPSRKSPIGKHGVLTVSGFGIKIRMQVGHLEIEHGIGTDRHYVRLPRVGHGLKRLVCIGSDGFVSLAAIKWLAGQNASFVLLERNGKIQCVTGPVRPSEAKLRRSQALAAGNGTGLEIAQTLIDAKLRGEERVLREQLHAPTRADVISEFRQELNSANTFDAIRSFEANAAAAYFREWRFLPVMWPKADLKKIPDHWHFAGSRQSPLSGGPRLAVTPVHAVLNYCFALLQAETRLCLSALGLDPGLGIGLHTDTANRDSLALDVLEPIRPEIEMWLLNWISSEPLRRADFFETGSGNCRLVSGLCKKLSETGAVWRKLVAPWAEYVAEIRTDLQRLKRDTDSARVTISAKTGAATSLGLHREVILPAAMAVLALSVGSYFYFHRAPKLTDKDTIVLADFTNTTGDPVFEETLRRGLAVQLEQSPFLSLVSDERIQRTLGLMSRPPDARLTAELAREICERTTSAAVLDGSIASLGSQYVLGLRAKDCRTGEVLAEEQAEAARKEDVLNVFSQLATKFRARLGESLTTVEKHNTPLEVATTSSLDALKAYSTGIRVSLSKGFIDALPHFKRAVEIDPQFAIAYASMGLNYSGLGESVLSMENTSKAYQLRDRASDRERFFITTVCYRQVTGNLEKAQQTLHLWEQTYPRDRDAHGLLSGFASQGSGQYEKSIEEGNIALGIDRDFVFGYVNVAYDHFYLGRWAETEEAIQKASAYKDESPDLLILQYYLAFVNGDRAGMDRVAALVRGKPGVEDWILHAEALVEARSGRPQAAGTMSHRARDVAQQTGQRERAATYQAAESVWQAFFGDAPAARASATAALQLSNGRDVEYAAAFALALAGDLPRAQSLADDLERRFPEDTSVQFNYLPALRAVFALNHSEPAKAIELLQVAVPYELAVPAVDFNAFFGGLYPVYVRGLAYLAAHQSVEAAGEFQKILDHRGIVFSDPIGALARLQLGRAYTMQGDTAKAKAAYQDFLTLWKDADPDVPILKEAKAEYTKL